MAVARPINVTTTGAGNAVAAPATLYGVSVRENAGSAAATTLTVFDATAGTAAAAIVATVRLAADGSGFIWFPQGIKMATGVRTNTAGTVEGVVYVG